MARVLQHDNGTIHTLRPNGNAVCGNGNRNKSNYHERSAKEAWARRNARACRSCG